MKESESYYETVLEQLKELSDERGLTYSPSPRPGFEWILKIQVGPGRRAPYAIEGPDSGLVGIVVVPTKGRDWPNRAWNRIEQQHRENLRDLERNGYKGKRVAFLFIQVWEDDRQSVLVPFKELEKRKLFRDKGDFTIKKAGGEFFLVGPRLDEPIKLRDRLDEVFAFL